KTVSSQELADRFNLNSAQVRKDLAYFGEFGVRGIGYYVSGLKAELQKILGLDRARQAALVGFGNLGSALFHYTGIARPGRRAAVSRGVPALEASGLWGASRALVAAALVASTGRPLLLLAPGAAERHRAALDLGYFLSTWPSSTRGDDAPPVGRVLEFPPDES